MTKIFTKTGPFPTILALAAALLLMCSLVSAAEKKSAQPEQKTTAAATTSAEPGEEYAACSPVYSGKEISAMESFLRELSPELGAKVKPILLKCDFKVNDQLLTTIAAVQEEMGETDFLNPEEEADFRQEKAKEIEIQVLLSQQPVNQAELKKLVTELFEIRQKSLNSELADLEKQAEMLKKRIEERKKLKDQITDRKVKELVSGEPPASEGKEPPPPDPLAWD